MIVASRERYLPVVVNTLVLRKDNWYFYLHRDVYDQAVVLNDRYDETFDDLVGLVGSKHGNEETVRWFYEQAPRPLHILAPFIHLIDGKIERDMELVCGALHVITAMIHIRQFILKPLEIRKSVSFSLTIKEEYELAWERFFVSSIPYDQRGALIQGVGDTVAQPASRASLTDTIALFPEQTDRLEPLNRASAPRVVSTNDERTATRNLLLK
ncbi:hypothetical protein [Cohnella cellulosilytica]|uniref:Uncharacterized protein n=1 Tax=Cohnella cellulosilytica TaxID=986710 RepID=A0ABW2F5X4_9BACL